MAKLIQNKQTENQKPVPASKRTTYQRHFIVTNLKLKDAQFNLNSIEIITF